MVQWIRSLVFFAGMLVSAILYTPVALAASPLPAVTRSNIIGWWAKMIVAWLRITCGLRHRVVGLENLPPHPCVILSKHQSAWETIAYQAIFPAQAWVLKRELLWIPLFGWGLAATRPIAIDRKAGVRALDDVVKQGTERLAGGRYVVVFPEGTRMPPGERGRYNPGGAMLAARAGVPVAPVAHNSGSYWRRRGFMKRSGVIEVRVGPPIDVEGRRAKQINAEAEAWIEGQMVELEPGLHEAH
ncbi:MAG: lysophospholipid acyltransferase family protein [Gammaproteobacteria bacterium]|nr:lysophospholipid acyltransferase family protein [Gammaproteobacteria bacterium]